MNYINKIIIGIKGNSAWLGGVLSFFLPVVNIMNYLLLFIFIDLITGVYASKKEGKVITSNCMRRTVTKMLSYFSVILLCHCLDLIMGDFFGEYTAMKVVGGLIAFVELISNCENLYRITHLEVFYIITQFSITKFIDIFKISPKKDDKERIS